MARFCTECGHAITDDMTVCPECGTRLQDNTPQAAPSPEKPPEKKESEKTTANPDVCPKCGTPYRPGVQFCTECGTRRAAAPQTNAAQTNPANPTYTAAPAGVSYPPQQSTYTAYAAVNEEPRGGAYGVVSTGAFFWLNVLFNLPGIGWLFCVIFSFAPQNVNIRHFARSRLIVLLIVLLLAGLAWGVIAVFGSQILAALSDLAYEMFY